MFWCLGRKGHLGFVAYCPLCNRGLTEDSRTVHYTEIRVVVPVMVLCFVRVLFLEVLCRAVMPNAQTKVVSVFLLFLFLYLASTAGVWRMLHMRIGLARTTRTPLCLPSVWSSKLGPCLVFKKFQYSPSHRILRHMHEALNIKENKS